MEPVEAAIASRAAPMLDLIDMNRRVSMALHSPAQSRRPCSCRLGSLALLLRR